MDQGGGLFCIDCNFMLNETDWIPEEYNELLKAEIQNTKNMKDVSFTVFVLKFTRFPEEIHHLFFVDLKVR